MIQSRKYLEWIAEAGADLLGRALIKRHAISRHGDWFEAKLVRR
jgi:hypothetical protein